MVAYGRTGDRVLAERAAAGSGHVLGILLIGVGWISVLRGALSGLWMTVIGFFVLIVASAERQHAKLVPAPRGARNRAMPMTSPVETCPDWITARCCVDDVALRAHHSTLVLTAFDGHPGGLVHLKRLARIPAPQREK